MKKLLLVVALLVAVWFYFTGSGENPETKPGVASQNAPAPLPAVVAGKVFNSAFPKSADGMEVKFTQEKEGYSQADLVKGGRRIAQLSISDTNSNPSARDKFAAATKKLGGMPMAAVGSMGTAVLVGGRYQVQVRSLDPMFTASSREAWLDKFELGGLSR